MIRLSAKSVENLKLASLYILSSSIVLRFDFLFGGANRFVPFRVLMLLTLFWFFAQFFEPFRPSRLSKATLLFLSIFLLYFSLAHLYWVDSMESLGPFLRNQFHFVYILAGYFLTNYLATDLSKDRIQTLVKFIIGLVLTVVSLETSLRYLMPTLDLNSESTDYLIEIYTGAQQGLSLDTFYFFKMSSVMFFDSNYVGAFLLIFFALHLFVDYRSYLRRNLVSAIFLLLIFFTLSRAAIFVIGLWLAFNFWNSRSFVPKWVFVIICVMASILTLFIIQDNVAFTDGSFITKIQILEGLSGFFEQDFPTALFGIGYEVGGYLYSYMSGGYAHIHLAILLGELGLIGTLIYFAYWYFIGIQSGSKVLYIFIPFFIVGLSLADPWEVGYFWASAIIARL